MQTKQQSLKLVSTLLSDVSNRLTLLSSRTTCPSTEEILSVADAIKTMAQYLTLVATIEGEDPSKD